MAEDPQYHYYAAFGNFIQIFSVAEYMVSWFLRTTASVDEKTAGAIFSGAKIDTAMSFVRRIYEARDEPMDPMLDKAFAQLSVINAVRNELVHYGVRFELEGGAERVTTRHRAYVPSKARVTVVSRDALKGMMIDLQMIISALGAVYFTKDKDDPKGLELYDLSEKLMQHPWRYKPQSPKPSRRKTLDIRPKQPRPPKPSAA